MGSGGMRLALVDGKEFLRELEVNEVAKEPIFKVFYFPTFGFWGFAAKRPKATLVIKQYFDDIRAASVEFDHLASSTINFFL